MRGVHRHLRADHRVEDVKHVLRQSRMGLPAMLAHWLGARQLSQDAPGGGLSRRDWMTEPGVDVVERRETMSTPGIGATNPFPEREEQFRATAWHSHTQSWCQNRGVPAWERERPRSLPAVVASEDARAPSEFNTSIVLGCTKSLSENPGFDEGGCTGEISRSANGAAYTSPGRRPGSGAPIQRRAESPRYLAFTNGFSDRL